MTKLLTPDILFSIVVRAVVVAKLAMLGILFLTLFVLELRAVVLTMLVILGISFLTSFILGLRELLVAKLVMVFYLQNVWS